jgi:hypothetical protein
MNQFRGKITSVIFMILLIMPFFVTFVAFSTASVLGARDDTTKESQIENIAFNMPINFNVLSWFSDDKTPNIINKNKDLIVIDEKNNPKKTSIPNNDLKEISGKDLNPNANNPFKAKVIVKDQKEDVSSNTSYFIKGSYDLTYQNVTTTLFVENIDPRLNEDIGFSISPSFAKRLNLKSDVKVFEGSFIKKR